MLISLYCLFGLNMFLKTITKTITFSNNKTKMFVHATSGANKSNSIIKLSLLLQQKQFINKPQPMFALEYSKANVCYCNFRSKQI